MSFSYVKGYFVPLWVLIMLLSFLIDSLVQLNSGFKNLLRFEPSVYVDTFEFFLMWGGDHLCRLKIRVDRDKSLVELPP